MILCVWFLLVVNTSASDCLQRLVPEMICYVSGGSLNSTHSFAHSVVNKISLERLCSMECSSLQSMHRHSVMDQIYDAVLEAGNASLQNEQQNSHDFLSTLRARNLSRGCWSDDFLVAVRTTASKISSTPSVSEP